MLQKYGNELGLIHKIPSKNFNIAKQRIINEIPSQKHYSNFDFNTTKIINYLKENHPKITFDTFILYLLDLFDEVEVDEGIAT